MTRKRFLKTLLGIVAAPFVVPARLVGESIAKLHKPLAEWRRLLPQAAYTVLFEEATERSGSSPLNQEKRPAPLYVRPVTCRCSMRPPSTRVARDGLVSTRRSRAG